MQVGQRSFKTIRSTVKASFKGIVQRDLTGVETKLKKSVLLSYSVGKFFFLILKGHYHEKSIKPISASLHQLN
jgi:hypothetical protein